MEIRWTPRASRDMDDLVATSPRVVAAIVELVYDELARDPRRVGKPLRFDLEGFYQLDVRSTA